MREENRQIFANITHKRRIISIKYDLMLLQVLYFIFVHLVIEHKILLYRICIPYSPVGKILAYVIVEDVVNVDFSIYK